MTPCTFLCRLATLGRQRPGRGRAEHARPHLIDTFDKSVTRETILERRREACTPTSC
jgi:hypothetical protein